MRSLLAVALLFAASRLLAAAAEPGYPIDEWLAEAAFTNVALSGDGNRLAFALRKDDPASNVEEHTIWWIDLNAPGDPKPARLMTATEAPSELRWSPEGTLLSWLGSPTAAEAPQLFTLDPAQGGLRRVTNPTRFAAGILTYDWLPDGSGVVFAAGAPAVSSSGTVEIYGDVRRLPSVANPGAQLFRLARADFASGKAALLADAGPSPESLRVSPDGSRLAFAGGSYFGPVRDWEVSVLALAPAQSAPIRTRNWVYEERVLWAGSDLLFTGAGEEREGRYSATEVRLYRVEPPKLGGWGGLARLGADLEGGFVETVPLADGSVLATALVSTRTRVYRIEPATGRSQTLADHRGTITLLSASRDGKKIAFVRYDRRFPEIWLADGPDGFAAARVLTSFNAALDRHPAPEVETISWSNGAGDTIEGVLLWPPGRKGQKGLPLVVSLHGGPFGVARAETVSLEGSPVSSPGLLASRGFLVLSPNFRGGAGRGDAFTRAVEGHHCSRPSADVISGVEHLIALGWADRERLGVIGYSGGGRLTNCLIGRTRLFRAAVSGAGMWNDISLAVGSPRGRFWAETYHFEQAPWEDFARYWEESPISRTGQVKTPTLITMGELDNLAQAGEMYRSLVWSGVPAELLIYPGEGHIFRKPSHKRTKLITEVAWLEKRLLGQAGR